MNTKLAFFLVLIASVAALTPIARAQELDGSEIAAQVRDRDVRVNKLSIEDQLKLRAAEQKAAQEPAVKAAMEKRNKAIEEFRMTVREAMIKADPTLAPLLERVAIPNNGKVVP